MLLVLVNIAHATEFFSDYDQDGIEDKMELFIHDNDIELNFWMSSMDKMMSYSIKKEDDEPLSVANHSQQPAQILLDRSYSGAGGQVSTDIYEWNSSEKNWILQKIITGEKADPNRLQFMPLLNIQRVQCCHILGSENKIEEKEQIDTNQEIAQELLIIANELKNSHKNVILAKIGLYDATEFAQHLDDNNLVLLNDLAFFLTDYNKVAAAIILENIVERYPERVVAKLNLADIYWDIDKESGSYKKAIPLYQEYYTKMIQKGLKGKIPKRVWHRMQQM